jgi:hypothetical protein
METTIAKTLPGVNLVVQSPIGPQGRQDPHQKPSITSLPKPPGSFMIDSR